MEIRSLSFDFPSLRGGGPRTLEHTVVFPRPVVSAVAALVGYSARFGDDDDHHLGRLEIAATSQTTANAVVVRVAFGLRDWSGNWDDSYAGLVDVTVLADLEAATAPARRTDLMIAGVETTQAIQHFRSSQRLNPEEGGPDNSIPLIARKDTALRVYVDYSPDASAPKVNWISGEVRVRTSSGSVSRPPQSPIQPRSDAATDRNLASHTLNFVIPEAWCQGDAEVTCEVFDVAAPGTRSLAATWTLRFVEIAPLSTFGVGVHYTGQGLNLPAPSMADAVATLDMAERLFPVGEIDVNGYMEIPFDKDMRANIADGCGDGFNDLLDVLRDLRGDSEDLYWAVLPGGINTGSVGGCGGGGVAAQFAGDDRALAEEFGHALGRQHAPAGTTPAPADPDGNYPDYQSLPSGSIGEVGYDPATDRAMDPGQTFDFMGYGAPEWVSPYTYVGLMGRMAVQGPDQWSPSARAMAHLPGKDVGVGGDEPRRDKHETLFLRLAISRDRKVERQYLFHYPAFPTRPEGDPTEFAVEFLDENGRVLSCSPLHQRCLHCHPKSWPKRIRQNITYPEGARRIAVWEGRDRLYEEPIPEPPHVVVRAAPTRVNDVPGYRVSWQAVTPGANPKDEAPAELEYLVQWQDSSGAWRGVSPRTRHQEIFVPAALFSADGTSRKVPVRVLASSGIATGCGETILEATEVEPRKPRLVLHGRRTGRVSGQPTTFAPLLRVTTLEQGKVSGGGEVRWFDDTGCEIGRGRTLDARQLSPGTHLVTAEALHLGAGAARSTWLVERTETGVLVTPQGDSEPTRSRNSQAPRKSAR
jgi:hypothetical protein